MGNLFIGRRLFFKFAAAIFLNWGCLGMLRAETWTPPNDLSHAEQNAIASKIVTDVQGNGIAIWSRFNGTCYVVQTSLGNHSGNWTSPLDLSDSDGDAFFPQIAVDPKGKAIAVWAKKRGSTFVIQAASKFLQNRWSDPVDISGVLIEGHDAKNPQIDFDGNGNALAVWQKFDGTTNVIHAAYKRQGEAGWSAPFKVRKAQEGGQGDINPDVALDAIGNAVVVWTSTANGTVESSTRPLGGRWSKPVALSAAGQILDSPHVQIDVSGNAAAVWSRYNGTYNVIEAATRPFSGKWTKPIMVSTAGSNAFKPQISYDAGRTVYAVWHKVIGPNTIVQGAFKPPGKNWSLPVNISAAGQDASDAQVVGGAAGIARTVWKRSDGANFVIQASRYAGGVWSTAATLSSSGEDAINPHAAIDIFGNSIAVWERSDGVNSLVQSAHLVGSTD